MTRRNIPLRRFGNAADVAEAVCFLASDRAAFIWGRSWTSTAATGSERQRGETRTTTGWCGASACTRSSVPPELPTVRPPVTVTR